MKAIACAIMVFAAVMIPASSNRINSFVRAWALAWTFATIYFLVA